MREILLTELLLVVVREGAPASSVANEESK